jgi:hypothetical protein
MEERPCERVLTMTDYYDGPRRGIANFDGRPHAYESLFDDHVDAFADLFELLPVDDETLHLALEDWAIWLRWEDAFYAGKTTLATHPALPADRTKHDEIAPILKARMDALPGATVRARGLFRPAEGHTHGGRGRHMEVQWIPEPPARD